MPPELTPDQLAEIGPVLLELRNGYGIVSTHWVDVDQVVIGRVYGDEYLTDLMTATEPPTGGPRRT